MRYILTALMWVIICTSYGQEIVGTGGDFYEQEGGSISFTIGEPVIETIVNEQTGLNLTQGFQQGSSSKNQNDNAKDDELDLSVSIYPNPTIDNIKIKIEEPVYTRYQLFDLNGILIDDSQMLGLETKVSSENCLPSIYILKIYSVNDDCKTFQIIKK